MTIVDAFIQYMEEEGVGTFGQNIYYGEAPSSNDTPDGLWWIVDAGGRKTLKLKTGEAIKEYVFNLYRRDKNHKLVKDALFSFEESLNCSSCVNLQGYQAVEIEVISFPIDQDLDSEDRKIGLLQINIRVYREC